jgi:lipoprotein-anchoring transpeptidase ErfK/SrfK
MRRFLPPALVALVLIPLALALPARAAETGSVTLKAQPTLVVFGSRITFSGAVSPPAGGQPVVIEDAQDEVLAQAITKQNGTYATSATPRKNAIVHAVWQTAASKPVKIHVQPRLSATRSPIRLFEPVKVSGRVVPALTGTPITVSLWRAGTPVMHEEPTLSRRGTFAADLRVDLPGEYRVVVRFDDADHAPVTWRSKPGSTPVPTLHIGSSGPYVAALENRLSELQYRVANHDGHFDYRDADSVLAFHKVQGMARTTFVDAATWRALASPKTLVVRGAKTGTHWEVSLSKQVLYLVRDGEIRSIIHVSTGKPSTPTLPGWFHVWTKQPGTNDKGMYFSSFFDGSRALHGYPEVPPYAASHGCVRMPFWDALYVYNLAPIGIGVIVHW